VIPSMCFNPTISLLLTTLIFTSSCSFVLPLYLKYFFLLIFPKDLTCVKFQIYYTPALDFLSCMGIHDTPIN
jgi:hypothetical protein